MQASHRKRHRVIWALLAVVIPVLFVVAILGRKTVPHTDVLPLPVSTDESGN